MGLHSAEDPIGQAGHQRLLRVQQARRGREGQSPNPRRWSQAGHCRATRCTSRTLGRQRAVSQRASSGQRQRPWRAFFAPGGVLARGVWLRANTPQGQGFR